MGHEVDLPEEGPKLKPAAVTSFHGMVADMLEELHKEARFCSAPEDARLMLAKRDALMELGRRMRGLPMSAGWARLRPTLQEWEKLRAS
jgi:hypothetical protein